MRWRRATGLGRTLFLKLSTRRRIGDAMARWPAARRFVRRFVAGEGAEDALRVIARLNAQGLLCAVTYLGENVVTAADAAQAGRAYVELLGEIERRRLAAVPSLKLTHLGLDLGEAVDGLDLRVRRGELYGFLGPNGAGKSTTLRMLCGILEPTDGEGRVLGIDLRRDPERVKSAIGYMSQRFSLYDDLTVEENLTFYARVYMVPRADRPARIQTMLRLGDLVGYPRQLAGQLSGGYRQRLALTCALVHGPRLVFLDEPTAGVDPVSRRTLC